MTRVLRYLVPSKPHNFWLLHERNNEKHIPSFPELQKKANSSLSAKYLATRKTTDYFLALRAGNFYDWT
jgi:hypothetical protein